MKVTKILMDCQLKWLYISEISQFSGGLAPECKAPGVANEEMPLIYSNAIVAHEQDELNPVERLDASLDQTSSFGTDDSAYEGFDVAEEKVTTSSGNMKCDNEKNGEGVCRTDISIKHLSPNILDVPALKEEKCNALDGSGVIGETERVIQNLF